MSTRQVGDFYERVAVSYLEKAGVKILCKNFRIQRGEIDIIGREADYLVFFEVKYRKERQVSYEAVSVQKQRKVRELARIYLYKNKISENTNIRFDAICIHKEGVDWIKDAF